MSQLMTTLRAELLTLHADGEVGQVAALIERYHDVLDAQRWSTDEIHVIAVALQLSNRDDRARHVADVEVDDQAHAVD
eukprot:953122-Heterocapsa_arctica.AAC.1